MKELLKALFKFQCEITPIMKDTTNPFFKKKYASLPHIQEHIKPVLISCGLIVIQKTILNIENNLYVETNIVHAESGEFNTSIFPVIANKQDAQSYGSAVSYAKRYSLTGELNLTIEDSDDDGNLAVEKKPTVQSERTWLTDEQFSSAMGSDKKGIEATLKKFAYEPYAIKVSQKLALESKLQNILLELNLKNITETQQLKTN